MRKYGHSTAPWTVLVLAMLIAQGCSSGETDVESRKLDASQNVPDPRVSLDLIRNSIHGDYQASESPAAELSRVSVAAEGVISQVYSGSVDIGPEDQGLMLVDVKVSETLKGSPTPTITVLFDWAASSPTPVDSVAQGLPPGTRVFVFGDPTSWPRPESAPPGSVVIETTAEGFIVETSPDAFDVAWGERPTAPGWQGVDTFSDLRGSLDMAGSDMAGSKR